MNEWVTVREHMYIPLIEGIGGLVKLQFLKSYRFQSIKTQSNDLLNKFCLPPPPPPPPKKKKNYLTTNPSILISKFKQIIFEKIYIFKV